MNMKRFFAIAAVALALTFGLVSSAQAQQTNNNNTDAYRAAIQLAALWGNKVLAANPQTDQEWSNADQQAWTNVTGDANYKALNERQQAKVRGIFEAAAVGVVFPKAVVDQALQGQSQQRQTQNQSQTVNYPQQQQQQQTQPNPVTRPGSIKIFLGNRP